MPSYAPELAKQNAGFKPSEFAALSSVERDNWWFRNRNRLIGKMLLRYVPRAQSVLDIGCGTGHVLAHLRSTFPQAALHGSEIYAEGLRYAADRLKNVTLFQADARALPYASEFDAVVALDIIEHIQEDREVLGQIFQTLKPNGIALITVPQHEFLWSLNDEHACHVRRYEAPDLREKLSSAGFRILRMTSFVSLLLPLALASRLRRRNAKTFNPMSEYNIPRWLNGALYAVSTVERAALNAGVNFPMGSSLLAICAKP